MKRSTTALCTFVVMAMAIAVAPAFAGQVIGGHNETSEVNGPLWAVGTATPGGVIGHAADHLLITEVIVTPTPIELIEIHNPTSEDVDLTNYYLTDAWFSPSAGVISSYHQLPAGTLNITTSTDFCSRFPAGTVIPAGGTIVVAMYGAGVDSTYGTGTATFEVTSSHPDIPDMISVGNNTPGIGAGATTLTNTREFVMLFYWDGLSDNVCDVDYVTWGSIDAVNASSRVDKTGLAEDGPDCDAIATPYNSDTAPSSQSSVSAPGSLLSVARKPGFEGAEAAGGNGCIPVIQVVCPLSQGYWKNHEEEWVPCAMLCALKLGTVVYTQAEWLALWGTPPAGDASLILAHQLMSAKLNACNGAVDTPIETAIADADALIGSSTIPMGVHPSTPVGHQMTALAEQLDEYNNGLLSGAECAESHKQLEDPLGSGGVEKGLRLEQNVPNPFHGPTSLTFGVPAAGQVRLGVFDLAGRRIKSIVDGHREAGTYTEVWSGRDDSGARVMPGIYFYRLQTAGKSTMRRMMVIP